MEQISRGGTQRPGRSMGALRHIRSALTDDMANSIACALVGSRLDYANSVLFGVTQRNINRLQRVQNTLARIVTHTAALSRTPSASLLNQLHWFPVDYRIKFKLAVITYNVIFSSEPAYLRSLLEFHAPARSLRSSSTNLLHVPLVRSVFGSRGFSVAAPTTEHPPPFPLSAVILKHIISLRPLLPSGPLDRL